MGGSASLDRRRLFRLAGAVAGAGVAAAGCQSSAAVGGRPVTLGLVSARSGPVAGYGQADDFVLADLRGVLGRGLLLDGRVRPVRVVVRDSGSVPATAARAARELIAGERVDMVLACATAETTVPVADQCEAAGVPCVTTGTPYQSWFLARKGGGAGPAQPFRWTWHFLWGLEDIIAVFADMWAQLHTDQVVGVLWPDSAEGRTWGDQRGGFPAFLRPQGYRIVDPGRFRAGRDDFAAQVGRFRAAGAQILTGVPAPGDFAAFWHRARGGGYRPTIASLARALTFPAFLEALGNAAGLSAEVSWSPAHPFRSSLTGATATQLAEAFTARTGQQWIQPLGLSHAMFEVAVDAVRRAGGTGDRAGLVAAVRSTALETVAGRVAWADSQADLPNVARTPLVGGQWRASRRWPLELVVVSNAAYQEIPATGALEPLR